MFGLEGKFTLTLTLTIRCWRSLKVSCSSVLNFINTARSRSICNSSKH
jgi:hypothetical protein